MLYYCPAKGRASRQVEDMCKHLRSPSLRDPLLAIVGHNRQPLLQGPPFLIVGNSRRRCLGVRHKRQGPLVPDRVPLQVDGLQACRAADGLQRNARMS
jgi:hypothetical protein